MDKASGADRAPTTAALHTTKRRPRAPHVDGRHQRSARTRETILGAYLSLVRSKPRLPTAEQVARRAKVSERAVFAHFADMPALGIAAFDYAMTLRRPIPVGQMAETDRPSRIRFHVEVRARTCETWLPLWKAVMIAQCGLPAINRRIEIVHEMARARLKLMYAPELAALDEAERVATLAALESLIAFESWGRLREHYKLGYDDACAAWIKMVDRLLPPTPENKPLITAG